MSTSSTERIDQLALVWLAMPRKESRLGNFYPQLKPISNGVDDAKRLAHESIERLRERGLIQPGNPLKLTETGLRQALDLLGVSRIPPKTALPWAKKILLLRSLNVEPTPAALKAAANEGALAARVLARRNRLGRTLEASLSKVAAVLAWRALGLQERPTFTLAEAFSAIVLKDASPSAEDDGAKRESTATASATVALRLGDCELRDFAAQVNDAARSSRTGRWHDAVFISHVWNTLRARGNVGITFEDFQRRLVEAHQADMIELSRADLVDAMPTADVSESETKHFGARFHFIRLEQLAS